MYIAIDFDGTIVEHEFPKIGSPIFGAFEWMKKFQEAGATLILWTMRSDGQKSGDVLTQAVEFCEKNGIVFELINSNPQDWTTSPKAYAYIYIDDNAFGCPLVENPKVEGRPFVNWNIIGPAVMNMIKERGNQE